jgi:molybdopterin converting factor small subunit
MSVSVRIPTILRSFTGGAARVSAQAGGQVSVIPAVAGG